MSSSGPGGGVWPGHRRGPNGYWAPSLPRITLGAQSGAVLWATACPLPVVLGLRMHQAWASACLGHPAPQRAPQASPRQVGVNCAPQVGRERWQGFAVGLLRRVLAPVPAGTWSLEPQSSQSRYRCLKGLRCTWVLFHPNWQLCKRRELLLPAWFEFESWSLFPEPALVNSGTLKRARQTDSGVLLTSGTGPMPTCLLD